MTVRVAVIGAGVMGADHARILAQEVSGARVVVVVDADAERARAVAGGCGADAGSDPLAAIGRRDVDAVLVASPDDSHAGLTLAAIAAGKPVLCEKPLAPSAEECRRVVSAEVAAGRRLVQVGFMRRFDPGYVEMKRALEGGAVGAALTLHGIHRNVMAAPGANGRPALLNSAPHEYDIARFLFGAELASVAVHQAGPGRPLLVVIETAAGQLVSIDLNVQAAYGYDVRGELGGETGTLELNHAPATRLNAGLRGGVAHAADWRPRFADAYRLQDRAWVRSVDSGAPAEGAASAWDGLAATLVAEAAVRALEEGRRVVMECAEVPAFYRPA